MKAFVCGDTHGDNDIKKLTSKQWPEGKNLTKDDLLIILGDTGINWSSDVSNSQDIYLKKWLDNKPWTTCFIDGNHENFDRLYSIDIQSKWGGNVRQVSDSIYHFQRGNIFTFGDISVFVMGGGYSFDKNTRVYRQSWWPEEMPNYADYQRAQKNIDNHGRKIDYILTHTCSNRMFELLNSRFGMVYKDNTEEKPLRDYFDKLEEYLNFKQWHFGHFHLDYNYNAKYFCHYNIQPYLLEG